jgi:hypothetical protein
MAGSKSPKTTTSSSAKADSVEFKVKNTPSLIEPHRAELISLCRRYHVVRLELFGSAATSRFRDGGEVLNLLENLVGVHPR